MTDPKHPAIALAQFALARQTHLGSSRAGCWDEEMSAWDDYQAVHDQLLRIPDLEAKAAQVDALQAEITALRAQSRVPEGWSVHTGTGEGWEYWLRDAEGTLIARGMSKDTAETMRVLLSSAPTAPQASVEPSAFVQAVRDTVSRSLAAPLGASVAIDPLVTAEMRKFMRDEPSEFDRIPWGEFKQLVSTPQPRADGDV